MVKIETLNKISNGGYSVVYHWNDKALIVPNRIDRTKEILASLSTSENPHIPKLTPIDAEYLGTIQRAYVSPLYKEVRFNSKNYPTVEKIYTLGYSFVKGKEYFQEKLAYICKKDKSFTPIAEALLVIADAFESQDLYPGWDAGGNIMEDFAGNLILNDVFTCEG